MKASKSILPAALLCALLIAGITAIFALDPFGFLGSSLGGVRDREPGESDSLADLRKRLDSLEARLERRARRPTAPADAAEAEESPESPPEEEPLALRVERLESELQSLEMQVRGLAQDPVSRAFEYASSANGELRRRGIEMLGRLARSDPQALAAIRNLLGDPEASVREEALDALDDVNDRESIPRILELLADASPGVRGAAIESLSELLEDADPSDPQVQAAAASIAERLSDPESRTREQAADALGDFPGETAVPALMRSLEDADGEVRARAIDSLADLEAAAALPRLREMYDRDPGDQRMDLAMALRRLGDPAPFEKEVARLSQLAASGDDGQRRQAIRTLGRFEAGELRGLFERALEDPSREVRREAQEALEELED